MVPPPFAFARGIGFGAGAATGRGTAAGARTGGGASGSAVTAVVGITGAGAITGVGREAGSGAGAGAGAGAVGGGDWTATACAVSGGGGGIDGAFSRARTSALRGKGGAGLSLSRPAVAQNATPITPIAAAASPSQSGFFDGRANFSPRSSEGGRLRAIDAACICAARSTSRGRGDKLSGGADGRLDGDIGGGAESIPGAARSAAPPPTEPGAAVPATGADGCDGYAPFVPWAT